MCKNSLKDISILIIEDEVILALGLKETLKSFGYSILGIEANLQGVIKILENNTPTLAIVDIKLKGLNNGIEIAKYLWQIKKFLLYF